MSLTNAKAQTAPSMQDIEPRCLPSVAFTPSGLLVYQWQTIRRSTIITQPDDWRTRPVKAFRLSVTSSKDSVARHARGGLPRCLNLPKSDISAVHGTAESVRRLA